MRSGRGIKWPMAMGVVNVGKAGWEAPWLRWKFQEDVEAEGEAGDPQVKSFRVRG